MRLQFISEKALNDLIDFYLSKELIKANKIII